MSNIYQYTPSYIFKTGSKYRQLTEEFQDIFVEYMNNNSIISNESKKNKIFSGIKNLTIYITNGFFYSVKKDYDTKSNQEKIISAIYDRISKIYGGEEVFKSRYYQNIYDLAESSIFYSLGMEKYKKRDSFLWNPEGSFFKNFIKHTSEVPFKSAIHDFMKELSLIANESLINQDMSFTEDLDVSELTSKEIIEFSGIEKIIPRETKKKIIEYLSGDIEKTEDIKKYLELIYGNLSKKGIIGAVKKNDSIHNGQSRDKE